MASTSALRVPARCLAGSVDGSGCSEILQEGEFHRRALFRVRLVEAVDGAELVLLHRIERGLRVLDALVGEIMRGVAGRRRLPRGRHCAEKHDDQVRDFSRRLLGSLDVERGRLRAGAAARCCRDDLIEARRCGVLDPVEDASLLVGMGLPVLGRHRFGEATEAAALGFRREAGGGGVGGDGGRAAAPSATKITSTRFLRSPGCSCASNVIS